MFRGIIVIGGSTHMSSLVQGFKPSTQAGGGYIYAFSSVKEAKESVENYARTNGTQGLAAYILDEDRGVIVEHTHLPKAPLLTWEKSKAEGPFSDLR